MHSMSTRITIGLAVLVAAAAFAGCGGDGGNPVTTTGTGAGSSGALPQGGERVDLKPAEFTTQIDNPYWPMSPGARWVYLETDKEGAQQKVVVTVTDKTKMIANGIEARVVHDVVTANGEFVEVTDDWYAQDADGNIWYLGEDTAEYKNGKPASTEGSWEAGVDGAQAGVAVPAYPRVGLIYRQEYYAGQAEDAGKVLSLDARAKVPYGQFQGMLRTKDYTPLEPDLIENKFYAKGVGPVLSTTLSGGSDREVLLSYQQNG
jgi:hypothetical protein